MKEKENPRGKVNVEPGQAVAVVEEDVVVAEASLVDSTDEVETEVQEPRAEEVIKRYASKSWKFVDMHNFKTCV